MIRLLEHRAMNQQARFERFAADMLFAIASGIKIDAEKSPRFREQIDEMYANPFETNKAKQSNQMTAEEIKQYVRGKIRKLRGK